MDGTETLRRSQLKGLGSQKAFQAKTQEVVGGGEIAGLLGAGLGWGVVDIRR